MRPHRADTPPGGPAAGPRVRPATPADRAAVERLLTDAALPTAGVPEILERHAADFLVAEVPDGSGALAGVAGLEVCGRTALLRSVAVHPAWRQSGVARTLVDRLLADAEARGLDALYLLTTTAEGYFPRFGFARVDREAVPAEVAATLEFTTACPASAIAMARPLAGRGGAATT